MVLGGWEGGGGGERDVIATLVTDKLHKRGSVLKGAEKRIKLTSNNRQSVRIEIYL